MFVTQQANESFTPSIHEVFNDCINRLVLEKQRAVDIPQVRLQGIG